MHSRILWRFLLTSIFALILAALAGAQERRGTISGRVSDSVGAVLQGARIEVEPRAAATTSDGSWTFKRSQPDFRLPSACTCRKGIAPRTRAGRLGPPERTLKSMMSSRLLHIYKRSALAMLAVFLVLPAIAAEGGYSIIKKIPIPGQGSWDYLSVDAAARRLYVSHGTQVEVLDIDSGSIVGSIPKTPGVHGVAIAPELGRGFVSNGQASTVTIFDLKTLKPIADVPTGQKPDAIIYDAATSRVFVFNGASNSTTAIDAASGKVAGTVDLGGGPE